MTPLPTETSAGCRDCGCADDEAHKYSECFCRCHTRWQQQMSQATADMWGRWADSIAEQIGE